MYLFKSYIVLFLNKALKKKSKNRKSCRRGEKGIVEGTGVKDNTIKPIAPSSQLGS